MVFAAVANLRLIKANCPQFSTQGQKFLTQHIHCSTSPTYSKQSNWGIMSIAISTITITLFSDYYCLCESLIQNCKIEWPFLGPYKKLIRYKMIQKIYTEPSLSCIMLEMNKLCSSLCCLVWINQLRLNILRNCRMFHIFHSEFTFSLWESIMNTQIRNILVPILTTLLSTTLTWVIDRRDVEYPNILLRGTWETKIINCFKFSEKHKQFRLPIINSVNRAVAYINKCSH